MSKNSILKDIKGKLNLIFRFEKEHDIHNYDEVKKVSEKSKKVDEIFNENTINLKKKPNKDWRERELSEFNKIVLNAPIIVNIHKGSENSAELFGDEAFFSKLKTNISNKTLYISMSGSASTFGKQKMTICTEKLDYIQISGSSELNYIDAHEDFMKIDIQGASTVKIEGSVNILEVLISGAATLKAADLIINELNANSSGASTIKAHVKKVAKVKASGASSCTLYGNPSAGKVSTSGAATVRYN